MPRVLPDEANPFFLSGRLLVFLCMCMAMGKGQREACCFQEAFRAVPATLPR